VDWHVTLCKDREQRAEDGRPVHVAIDGKTSRGSYTVCEIPADLKSMTEPWAGVVSIGQAITPIEEGGECRVEVRYYLSSRSPKVSEFATSAANPVALIQRTGPFSNTTVAKKTTVAVSQNTIRSQRRSGPPTTIMATL